MAVKKSSSKESDLSSSDLDKSPKVRRTSQRRASVTSESHPHHQEWTSTTANVNSDSISSQKNDHDKKDKDATLKINTGSTSSSSSSTGNKITIKRSSIKSSSPLSLAGFHEYPTYIYNPLDPKPFKNPHYPSNIGSKRKWKNLKAITSSILNEMNKSVTKSSSDYPTSTHASSAADHTSNDTTSEVNSSPIETNFINIDAPPSLLSKRKYCDVTGLEAKYTDPKSGLRYHSAEIYTFIKHLSPHQIQEFLALRNANVILK